MNRREGSKKDTFIGTNMLTSFSHLCALYSLHQAVVLRLCHSESLVDRTDRVKEKNIRSVISHHTNAIAQMCYVWSWVCFFSFFFLPPLYTAEAVYLWRPQLRTGYPSCEWWCTTAPYTEASASNRDNVSESLVGENTFHAIFNVWMRIPPAPCVVELSPQGFHLP